MSLTHDAVKAIKSRMSLVTHRPHGKSPPALFIEPPELAPSSPVIDESLLAVARDGADIRRDHDAILSKFAALTSLKDELHAAFNLAYQALDNLAESRSQLARAEAVSKFERETREALSERLSATTSDYHRAVGELERLRPDVRRLESALRHANEKIADLEGEATANNAKIDELCGELERRRAEEARLRRALDAANLELANANAYVAQKVTELSQLHERCEIAEQASRSSNRALEEARAETSAALARLDEERMTVASSESRVAALEAQLRDLGEKFSSARAAWTHDAERANETISRLKEDLTQASGRDEALQRVLSAAQSEAGQLRRQTGDVESQLAELRVKVAHSQARVEAAEAAREQLHGDLANARNLHQSMLRRVKPMISALRDKSAEIAKLTDTLADFEKRFAQFQSESGATIRQLQDHKTQLASDLEAERARRIVAEGALAIDRSFRNNDNGRARPENVA